MSTSEPLRVAVLDLDDTLIDTRGHLLPEALARTAEAAGVPVGALNPRGKTAEEVLSGVLDLPPVRREAAAQAWYAPEVPPLEPLPGARELLEALRGRIHRVLLTRGHPDRQELKIDRSGLRDCFDEVLIRRIDRPGDKGDDLRGLLERQGCPPGAMAVIGDDLRDELHHGRELGCRVVSVHETRLEDILTLLEGWGLPPRPPDQA